MGVEQGLQGASLHSYSQTLKQSGNIMENTLKTAKSKSQCGDPLRTGGRLNT